MTRLRSELRRLQGKLLVAFPSLGIAGLEWLCRIRLGWSSVRQRQLADNLRMAFPRLNAARVARFSHQILLAQTRYAAAQRRLELLNSTHLTKEVSAIRVEGRPYLETALNEGSAVIIASPHYGAFMFGALRVALDYQTREVGFFYNDAKRNPYAAKSDELLMRVSSRCVRLRSDRKGILAALRILKRGGILCIMPDQITPEGELVYVPFFGRLFSVMQGIAFLSDKTGAKIIPAYCYENKEKKMILEFRPTVAAELSPDLSDRERHYLITEALFRDIETQLRSNLAPWRYWNQYAARTLPLGTISSLHELERQFVVLANHVKKSRVATSVVEQWTGHLRANAQRKRSESSVV